MNTGVDPTVKLACERPFGLTQKATDIGCQCLNTICVEASVFIRRHLDWPVPCQSTLYWRYIFGAGHTGVTAIVKEQTFISLRPLMNICPTHSQSRRCARIFVVMSMVAEEGLEPRHADYDSAALTS